MYVDIEAVTGSQWKFYKSLFSNYSNYIEIRSIKNGLVKEQLFLTYKELLNYPMPQDINAYIGVYERKYKGNGTTAGCTKTNAIYLDFDNMMLEEINYRIDNSGIPLPSMIISSGHGYHVYWLLDKPRGHELKPLIKALQNLLNADSSSTDIARVLRVPDTMNVKFEPKPCELVEANDNRATIKQFESILGVKAGIETVVSVSTIKELSNIKINDLNNMASGVKKGERNFCTGRIVKTLKRLNYTKLETENITFRWNGLNSPVKPSKELKIDIKNYWHDERYKYDGKEFSDDRLQELNTRFLDSKTKYFMSDDNNYHSYDNELLNHANFKKTNGLTFAVLSIIKLEESKGIRREHLASLSKRNAKEKLLRKSLNLLERMEYIKVIKKNRVNFYVFTEKGNYKRGYTAVSKSLHRSFIHGELKENEYKMIILLESYAYDNKKEIYPSNDHLSFMSGQANSTVRRNLKQLEHKQFIKTEVKKGKRYIRFVYR